MFSHSNLLHEGCFPDLDSQAQRKVRDALKNLQEQPSDPAREETVAPPATKKRKKESEKPTSDQVKIPVEEEQLFVPGADEKGAPVLASVLSHMNHIDVFGVLMLLLN